MIDLPLISFGSIGTINLIENKINVNYSNPIKFECQITGRCCKRNQIPITENEIQFIMQKGYKNFLSELPPVEIGESKTFWLKRIQGRCVFLKNNKCSIHKIKPFSCKIFPFSVTPTTPGSYDVIVPEFVSCDNIHRSEHEKKSNAKHLKFILNLLTLKKNQHKV